MLVLTWCAGASLPERGATARAFSVAWHQRRRRPGKTVAGLEKALGNVPRPVRRTSAGAVRLLGVFAARFWVDGLIPLAWDGCRQRPSYPQRRALARWPERRPRSRTVRRRWPGRTDHQPPGPLKILKMGTILKDKMVKALASAQGQTC